ncbi:MAG: phosphate ABC transporter substrate-binding/OmpA family protein [Rhodobacter sp.]|nr:phosphate ABC transporter substrate-binding/OmpA family protein [Rhodobacter sp.]
MTINRAAIFAALFLWAMLGRAAAEDVTLTSRDGSVEITGNLLSFDGEFYRVDTVYGVLTLDGTGVICDGPGCPDLTAFVAEVTFSGSRTMGEVLMPALVEAFAARNGFGIERKVTSDTEFSYLLTDLASGAEAARLGFRVTSTSEGFADLLANEADIVLSARPATPQEIALAREAGIGDLSNPRRSRIVALDAMVPVVAAANKLDGLTIQGLARVFSGEVENWTSLGGPDAPISLHLRDDASGISQDFVTRVLSLNDKELADGPTRHLSNAEVADAVAADTLAIGIVPYSALGNAEPLLIKGPCGMNSAAADRTIKTEDYPLTMPLFLYTPARRLPVLVREFLAYARSPAAQPVVGRAGFVDLRLEEVAVSGQGGRLMNAVDSAGGEVPLTELQRMVREMRGTERLSLSFRFLPGGTQLDAQSRSNVDVLAGHLERGRFDGRPMVFVGFSDGDGPAAANQRLALRRAEAVRREVLRAAPAADRDRLDLSVEAFGEAMPMACDETEWGKRINRRVEVWVAQR